jgi:hypothetical protein
MGEFKVQLCDVCDDMPPKFSMCDRCKKLKFKGTCFGAVLLHDINQLQSLHRKTYFAGKYSIIKIQAQIHAVHQHYRTMVEIMSDQFHTYEFANYEDKPETLFSTYDECEPPLWYTPSFTFDSAF